MSEIPEVIVGMGQDGPILRRVMTPDHIRERATLNVSVTAGSIRARVIAQQGLGTNGNGHHHHALDLPEFRL